jgi:DNA-binding transcriptional regulator YiaG
VAGTAELNGVDELVARARAYGKLPAPTRRRLIREEAAVSQRELARSLGVSTMTLNRWERRLARPRPEHGIAYAEVLARLEKAVR